MALQSKIRDLADKQTAINELQKQIGTYGKTRNVYKQWIASGRDTAFYEANRADITLHQAAKKYFNERGLKNLPSINQLRDEWAALEKQRRPLCAEHKVANQKFKDLYTAKSNASRILGLDKKRETSRGHGIEI